MSIPYHRVIGVASVDDGIVLETNEITLMTAAGRVDFEFRGADKAHWFYSYVTHQILNQAHPQLNG